MNKSLKAVFSPQEFSPPLIRHQTNCEKLWETNRPWIFSNMAHIAYFNELKIKEFMDELGAKKTCFYDKGGAQGFLAVWKSKAILSFRGSQPIEEGVIEKRKLGFFGKFRITHFHKLQLDQQSLLFLSNDVLADLKFEKDPFDDMENVEVHAGFLNEINKLWKLICEDIDRHVGNIPIWVTGHSLGAAMATLAGMRYPFEGVITFGEPRVGSHIDRAFKAKTHTRYVNGDDPVTKVPPELLFGYDHHGNVERISDSDGQTDFRFDHSIVYYSENLA